MRECAPIAAAATCAKNEQFAKFAEPFPPPFNAKAHAVETPPIRNSAFARRLRGRKDARKLKIIFQSISPAVRLRAACAKRIAILPKIFLNQKAAFRRAKLIIRTLPSLLSLKNSA
ncbi:MAG: hypothetical protein DBX55_03510 [Verrucomicrobia bacterium]|nr:MAG: hypothetical protein DBX55_03510 [Verrucomicrobiota bacterium]